MMRGLFGLALLVAVSAKQQDRQDIDIEKTIRMTICICDEPDYDMQLSLAEINGDVCQALFNEPMPEDMFNQMDADGSGAISFDEALAFASTIEDLEGQGRSYLSRAFSNNESPIEALCSIFIAVLDDRPVILAQVEAIVRVMGCACDNDWSMGISWEEANAGECVMVQTALFGQNVTEEMFNAADANGDGEIDGTEAATVIEEMMGQQAAGRSGLRKRSRKLRRRKLSKKSCKNCRN